MAYKISMYAECGRKYTVVLEEKETAELCFRAFAKSEIWEYVSLSEVEEKEILVKEWADEGI